MESTAFDTLYTESFSRIVGHIYAMCGDLAEAQDCVQEAFVKAWKRRRQLDDHSALEPWVRTVAWRLAVSRWRKARRALAPPDRSRLPTPPKEPSEDRVALIEAMRQIPSQQRRAIVLHYIGDLPIREVAREIGVPEGTVKSWLSRGRAALTSLLDDREPDEDETNKHHQSKEAHHA